MKQGITMQDFATELLRQKDAMRDFMVPAQQITLTEEKALVLRRGDDTTESFGVTQNFHRQLGTALDIPAKYYDKMLAAAPSLLADNVNTWLADRESNQLIRTLDGNARAFLSDSYRRIDNHMIAMHTLPLLSDIPGIEYASMQVTESRMYIKVLNPRLTTEVVPGDVVQSGILISNSETGQGSVQVMPLIYRLVCSNGMVVKDMGQRRNHIGRTSSENWELYSSDTLRMEDEVLLMKLRDTVKAAIEETKFMKIIDHLRETREAKITGRVTDVVELAGKEYGFGKGEQESILEHLSRGGDFSLYGLGNAITRAAQDVESYDRSTELEGIGWDVTTMSPTMWRRFNNAKPVAEAA